MECTLAFHALRPVDLRRGVSFPVGVAAWILPKVFWRTAVIESKYQCAVLLISAPQGTPMLNVGVHLRSYCRTSGVSFKRNAPWWGGTAPLLN